MAITAWAAKVSPDVTRSGGTRYRNTALVTT